jgi:Na+/H+ antiporter NhaA
MGDYQFQRWSVIMFVLSVLVLIAAGYQKTLKMEKLFPAFVALAILFGTIFIFPVVTFAILLPMTLIIWFRYYKSVLGLWDLVIEKGKELGKSD